MVARKQNFRHAHPAEYGGAGVLGIFQSAVGKAFIYERPVGQNAVDIAGDDVADDHGGQLAARQNIVADGYLLVYEQVYHALIYALVVAAQQHYVPASDKFERLGLSERGALGRHVDAARSMVGVDRLYSGGDGLGHHDHARPAAEGVVVALEVLFILGIVADIDYVYIKFSALHGAADYAHFKRAEHFGEER